MKRIILPISCLICLIAFLSCAESEEEKQAFSIVATTTQAGDLSRILTQGAEGVDLYTLMNAGVDPHLYTATLGDIERLNTADLIVYSGLNLEGQFERIFGALAEQGLRIHALSAAAERNGLLLTDEKGIADPHFWFDPRYWSLSAEALAGELAEALPEQAALFTQNAQNYAQELDRLFAWSRSAMQSVPDDLRVLLTSHDAFAYFAAALGWQTHAIQGLSTVDRAGIADIQATVDLVLNEGYPVIFVESSLPPDTTEAVIEAVRAEGGELRAGLRELFSDAMGDPATFTGSYTGMFAHNVLTILQSFGRAGVAFELPAWELQPAIPAAYFAR